MFNKKCNEKGCSKSHCFSFVSPPSDMSQLCSNSKKIDTDGKVEKTSVSSKKTLTSKNKVKLSTTTAASENSDSADASGYVSAAASDSYSTDASDSYSGSADSSSSKDSSSSSSLTSKSSSSQEVNHAPVLTTDLKKQKNPSLGTNLKDLGSAKATKTSTLIFNGTGTDEDSTNYLMDDLVCTDVNCTGCRSDHNSNVRNVFFGLTGALVVLMISYLVYIKYKTKGSAKKSPDYKELSGEIKI